MDWILIAEGSLLSWWLDPNNLLAVFKVAAGLGFVIFVHELGHFLVAKACGVKCEKFYVGFDFFELRIGKWLILPRALCKFRWGETEYGIGIIPLGGYVKMLGQDDNPRNMEQENERSRVQKEGQEPSAPIEHDPRSYLAKSVPQRMAIISAGVVMNLIFAVLFAAAAYMIGVPYVPCIIGDTIPGGAAWRAGVQPGDKVIQINGSGKPSEHLRWDWDLRNATGIAGTKGQVELLVRSAKGTESTVRLKPRPLRFERDEIPTLGVTGLYTTSLGEKKPAISHTPAAKAKIPFAGQDKVVAVRPRSQAKGVAVEQYADFERVAARHAAEDLFITVERAGKTPEASVETIEIEVGPRRMRTLGLVMRRGAISGVRPGSPADAAGLREGDIIRAFAGEPFGDPMTFPHRLEPYHGRKISLAIDRPDAAGKLERLTVSITPETPRRAYEGYSEDADFSVESLGIVYPVLQIVQEVLPGGPAEKSGIAPGDVITQAQLVPRAAQQKEEQGRILIGVERPIKLRPERSSWPLIDELVQNAMPETQIRLMFTRYSEAPAVDAAKKPAEEPKEAVLTPADSPYYHADRGLQFALTKLPHRAASAGEAFSLGLRQTYEDGTKIIVILRKLVTGQLSPTNLGGIGSISYVATVEASQGTSRLLLFLTFLSANLAVVNFLPIPVLDGGHMMFLAWEGIFRRPVPEKWQFQLTLGGLAFVLCLFLFVNGLDVYRFVVAPLMRWLG